MHVNVSMYVPWHTYGGHGITSGVEVQLPLSETGSLVCCCGFQVSWPMRDSRDSLVLTSHFAVGALRLYIYLYSGSGDLNPAPDVCVSSTFI